MKNNLVYRISTSVLMLGCLFSAFFLKMFTFVLTAVIIPKTYEMSLYDCIVKAAEKGVSTVGSSGDSSAFFEAVQPMLAGSVVFIVMLVIAILLALVMTILTSTTDFHVPQIIMSGIGFICLVIGAGFGTKALSCLIKAEDADAALVPLSSIVAATTGEVTTENALSTLGSAVTTVTSAAISYGYYLILAIFAIVFVWSIISYFVYKSGNHPVLKEKKAKK